MFISFYISDTYLSLASHLHIVGCEFPHPSKIDCFTYLTETENQMIESIFTDKVCYRAFSLNQRN